MWQPHPHLPSLFQDIQLTAVPPSRRPAWQVRGVSHEPVQERERPKSMLAAKSFSPTSDLKALHGWFAILAQARAARGAGRVGVGWGALLVTARAARLRA